MQDVFFAEARERLSACERALTDLAKTGGKDRPALVDELFRHLHTLKGGASLANHPSIGQVAHETESLLGTLRGAPSQADAACREAITLRIDWMSCAVEAIENGLPLPPRPLATSQDDAVDSHDRRKVAAATSSRPASPTAEQDVWHVIVTLGGPARRARAIVIERLLSSLGELTSSRRHEDETGAMSTLEANLRAPVDPARTLANAPGVAQVKTHRLAPAAGRHEAVPVAAISENPRVADMLAEQPPLRLDPGTDSNGRHERDATTRLSVARLDAIANLTGEVVLAKTRLANLAALSHDEQLIDAASALDRLTGTLYEDVLQTRLSSLAEACARLPRVARETARATGKEIALDVDVGSIEMDRVLLESIHDPLAHLVRNAIDHGIEPAREREQAGKPAVGQIRVRARKDGPHIAVSVDDDGRGVDTAALRRAAVRAGLIDDFDDSEADDADAHALAFKPGLSTTTRVTETSGRGVGMDAVRTWAEDHGGTAQMTSTPGQGTCTTLFLPLNVTLQPALVIRLGTERYLLPIDAVLATVDLSREGPSHDDKAASVQFHDTSFPTVDLRRAFAVPTTNGGQIGVLCKRGNERVCLCVDEIISQQEVVVKPLQRRFFPHRLFHSATILGDGQVALIVNVSAFMGDAPYSGEDGTDPTNPAG